MSSSSRVLSAPPRSARAREARTSFTPEKLGLPRTTIMVLAALVSSRRCFTSKGSEEGVSRRARSLAVSPTACWESFCSTAGSSKVFRDFSKKLMIFCPLIGDVFQSLLVIRLPFSREGQAPPLQSCLRLCSFH